MSRVGEDLRKAGDLFKQKRMMSCQLLLAFLVVMIYNLSYTCHCVLVPLFTFELSSAKRVAKSLLPSAAVHQRSGPSGGHEISMHAPSVCRTDGRLSFFMALSFTSGMPLSRGFIIVSGLFIALADVA
jgi:hypothetical protein